MLKQAKEIMSGDVTHAAVWLWNEELSVAEAAAIHARLEGDPNYREDFDGLLSILADMEGLAQDRAVGAIARDHLQLLGNYRTRRRFTLGIAAGALLAVGASLAVFSTWRGPGDSHLQMHFTRIGEQETIVLPDASVLTLNTGSQVVVDYGEQVRRIQLERGEAYFDVAEDADRPFTVDLGLRSVTAMGTEFNIRKLGDHYQVAVLEGVVALSPLKDELSPTPPLISTDGEALVISAPREHRIEAGWVAEYDASRNELKAFQPESMDRYQQWRSGMIRFSQQPLYKVVEEMNRYSRKPILIEDAAVMELEVYSVVHIQDIDAALYSLGRVLPVEVSWHYDQIVITASGENPNEQPNP